MTKKRASDLPATQFPSGLTLRVEDLALTRGGRSLAKGLTFSVSGGEALVVTGPNGAGKSTLLRTLAGLLTREHGAITLTRANDDAELATLAHYIAHADAQKSSLTVAENLAFWARMLGGAGGLSPRQALEKLALSHATDLPVGYLSAGQKRRAALARLLIAPRPLWLLDEPATALDSASQNRFALVMSAHLAAGGIIIAATHAPLGLDNARELKMGTAA
jgi:heme exporter protein A